MLFSLTQTGARYLLSGGVATLLHWSTMALLIYLGAPPGLATATGAVAGAILNYFLQFHFTFRSNRAHSVTVPIYLWVTTASWMANNLIFFVFFHLITLHTGYAQLLTTLMVTFLNLILYRSLVFHERENSKLAT